MFHLYTVLFTRLHRFKQIELELIGAYSVEWVPAGLEPRVENLQAFD